MTGDALFWALAGFALVSSITPGPNNAMLAASGANFGFRRSLAHMAGITLGFPAMIVGIGLGLGAAFQTFAWLHTALKYGGAAYLLWLAWKVANAGRAETAGGARPLTFLEAAGFQWINPKGWMMAVGALAAYTDPAAGALGEALRVAAVFLAASVVSNATWCGFGVAIGRLLRTDRALRLFNRAMALALVASLIPVFMV